MKDFSDNRGDDDDDELTYKVTRTRCLAAEVVELRCQHLRRL